MGKELESLPKFYVRGQIAPKQSLFDMFGGEEETVSASDLVKFLDDHKEDPEIVVEISSDGGYKSEGVEMRQILKNSDKVVHTIGYKVNSIATVVMLGNNNGGKRLVTEDAQFVIHFARIDPMNLGTSALTAEDFDRLAREVAESDNQILDIYCRELGEDKRTQLLAEMASERDLGAKGAIKLGFANGYYKKTKKEKPKVEDFKGYLIEDSIALIIQNSMEKEGQKELERKVVGMESTISALKKLFVKMFVGGVKNQITVVTDKGSLYVVPTDVDNPDNLVGAEVFEMADGVPTETLAADGEYTETGADGAPGRTLVVAAGKVTEVKEAIDAKKLTEDLNAEKAKNAALTAEVENLKTQMSTQMETIKNTFQTELDKVQNEFKEFKKIVPGDKKEKVDKEENPDEPDYSKMSRVQILAHERKMQKFK